MAIQTERARPRLVADELVSVTIDATDLSATSTDALRSIISRYGRPISARAFADFQQPGLSDLSVQLYQMGFTLVHCPTWPNGDGVPKPIVSDVMAQDLRDQLEELEDAETFILVATSRDYIAVANAIRRHDRRVVVVAEESKVCREFRMCADEFVPLPPSRADRQETARAARSSDGSRASRAAAARGERALESAKVERPVEPLRSERPAEPVRVERTPEPVRVEAQDLARLPSDAEVLAEVRRIIAAEGICTPRRLARALCPVDRTPTGELRSRIANRIQALVDSGKLLRERLVVGGTSVETILTREDRAAKASVTAEAVPQQVAPVGQPLHDQDRDGTERTDVLEPAVMDGMVQGEPLREPVPFASDDEGTERLSVSPAADLDAFVESVLRGTEPVFGRSTAELAVGTDADPISAESVADPAVAVSEAPEPPAPQKRTRSRRRSSSKAAVQSESNGAE